MNHRSASFDYTLDFETIDFRKQPELYRVGKGEQGVLLVNPYKSEILPHWRFKSVTERITTVALERRKRGSDCPKAARVMRENAASLVSHMA